MDDLLALPKVLKWSQAAGISDFSTKLLTPASASQDYSLTKYDKYF
jgi:hypothetical protein